MEKFEDFYPILSTDQPVYVDDVPIYPITLDDIGYIGYAEFLKCIRMVCMDEKDIINMIGGDVERIDVYNYYLKCAKADPKLMSLMLAVLSLATQCELRFSDENDSFIGNTFTITKEKFEDIQYFLRVRNRIADLSGKMLSYKFGKRTYEEMTADFLGIVDDYCKKTGKPKEEVMEYDLFRFHQAYGKMLTKRKGA